MLALPTKHTLKVLFGMTQMERGAYTPVAVLAKQADVPPAYLSKLIKQLVREGILNARKGPKGGVALPERQITFFEVCEALGDPIIFDSCMLSRKACSKDLHCPVHAYWSKERERIKAFLKKRRV